MTLVDELVESVEVAPVEAAATVVSLAFVAGAVAGVIGFLYRAYSRESSPVALNVLVGLGAVALWLNLSGALGNFVQGETVLVTPDAVLVNLISLVVGGTAAAYGGRLGDRAAVGMSNLPDGYDADLRTLVRSAGRNVVVRMPDADGIDDAEGYEPVTDETKKEVAGKRFVFPRGVTVEELRVRVADRIKKEYDVGYVDVEVDADGEVNFLGLGRSVSGIGPTLAPGTCAVALRADPAYASSAGDTVRVLSDTETGVERVAAGELRAAVEDTVTVALDAADARRTDPSTQYRMVTLPSEKGPEREFAAMLRSADETVSVVGVDDGSPLIGARLDSLGVTVVAVETPDGVEAVPEKTRPIRTGDRLYVVGRPDELRKLGPA